MVGPFREVLLHMSCLRTYFPFRNGKKKIYIRHYISIHYSDIYACCIRTQSPFICRNVLYIHYPCIYPHFLLPEAIPYTDTLPLTGKPGKMIWRSVGIKSAASFMQGDIHLAADRQKPSRQRSDGIWGGAGGDSRVWLSYDCDYLPRRARLVAALNAQPPGGALVFGTNENQPMHATT